MKPAARLEISAGAGLWPAWARRRPGVTQVIALAALTGFIWELWIAIIHLHPPAHSMAAYWIGLPLALIYALVLVNVRWLCRAFPLRAGKIRRALWVQLQAALVLAVAWSWGAGLVMAHWAPQAAAAAHWLMLVSLGLYALTVAIIYAVETWQAAQQAERDAAQAKVTAREAELRALRAQLNPHFLFNSLHSIGALAGSDPAGAREMCLHLSELYRLTLGLALRESIPLEQELAMLRAYVAVEAVRFGRRLVYQQDVPGDLLRLSLPSLLLQPLVENAIKHGIAGLTGPGILRLEARRVDNRLWLTLINDYDPESPSPASNGHGLENIRQRLAVHYGAGQPARLWLERKGGQFLARLELPAATFSEPLAAPALEA